MKRDTMILTGAIVAFCCFIIGIGLGTMIDGRCLRRQAVKAGAAYWSSDENGDPEFRWKDPAMAKILEIFK